MSSEEVPATELLEAPAAEQPQEPERTGFGAVLRRHPALFGLALVLFCGVMLAYEIVAPVLFTSKLDAYATEIPRFSDFAIMIDVEALKSSPGYDALDESVKRQLQLYPERLADAGIELGEGNHLQRILIAGKSQSRASLISFYFERPVTFTDGAMSQLVRQNFRDYDIWVRPTPDAPIWYFADRMSGLLMVSDDAQLISAAVDRRETGSGFRLYKELAEWAEPLDGNEPVWAAFTQLRSFRREGVEDDGRTLSGLVAAPPHRVPILGGTAWIDVDDDLTIHERFVFKTESQASDYVEERTAAASALPDGEPSPDWSIGDRLLAAQKIHQDGDVVTVEQTLPLDVLSKLLDTWPGSKQMYRLYLN